MKVDMPVGIRNKFTFHVDDIATGEHKEYEAFNIVLNSMWSRLVNFEAFFVNIHFGTGTGAFNDPARTSLYTHLGTKTATTEFQTRALPTSQWRRKIVLNPEEYVGATITEIGVAYGSTASNLVTHASPKDAEGNPIAIGPKTDTQIITIYADMYFVLAENMYGGKIKWVTPLANNELLSYLMGGTYPTQQFRVQNNQFFYDGTTTTMPSHGQSANILPANWIKDVANKKVTTPAPALTTRLGASVGNGDIWGYRLGGGETTGVFQALLPMAGVYGQHPITGEIIGTGDGLNDEFSLKGSPIVNSETIYVNDVALNRDVDYILNPIKKGSIIDWSFLKSPTITGSLPVNGEETRDPARIMDGNLTSSPPNNGTYYIIGVPYPIWLTVDLRENKRWKIAGLRYYTKPTGYRFTQAIIQTSNDYVNWTDAATISTNSVTDWQEISFPVIKTSFRYIRLYITAGNTDLIITEIAFIIGDQITFTTPPPAGSVITADYTVDYIPKDEFHVIDLQAAIQYGEVI